MHDPDALEIPSLQTIYSYMLCHLAAPPKGHLPVDEMPPDTILVEGASVIVGVTTDEPPTYRARLLRASSRHDCPAILLRHYRDLDGLEVVTADIAVPVRSRNSIALLMDFMPWTDGSTLWLLSPWDHPFILVGADGLRVFEEPPFRDTQDRDSGILQATRQMLGRRAEYLN